MFSISRNLVGVLLCLLTPMALACSKSTAPTVVGMRIAQPLVATPGGDDATLVHVGSDGCVRMRYPAWDTRAGSYAFALSAAELAHLRAELSAWRIAGFDPAQVKADLAARAERKSSARESVRVTDEEVIELRLEAAAGQPKSAGKAFVWTGLRQQRLEHPDQADIEALERTRDRLLGLGSDRRLKRVEN